jgi:L-lysine 6-transaminase
VSSAAPAPPPQLPRSAAGGSLRDGLARHLLVDGFPLVVDLDLSRGSRLVDRESGRRYLDLHMSFAANALGWNPPQLADDAEALAELGRVAVNKPANSDLPTQPLADFVETFVRVLGDPDLPHLFFVEGGALAVENALKCAFDWKNQHNEKYGRARRPVSAMHLTSAFHGRSGYTMSMTNTDPRKTEGYPFFAWPRIEVPAIRFPVALHDERTRELEAISLAQAERAFREHPHEIACFIAEPVQGEGGDNHLSARFLQAMQRLCRDHDALFVLDEVQTGVGSTGTAWCYQQLGLEPDVVAFAKKVQLGGIMAGRRVDDVDANVFIRSGRINSTWGGGLVDMVRSRRILEVIEQEDLFARARAAGARLLAGLQDLERAHPDLVGNARGRGLMCAFDLPTPEARDEVIRRLFAREQVIVLPSGRVSLRVRPALTISDGEIDEALAAIARTVDDHDARS